MEKRIYKLQQSITKSGFAAYVVSDPFHLAYLTGVNRLGGERELMLVITKNKVLGMVSPLRMAQFIHLNKLPNIQLRPMSKNERLSDLLNQNAGQKELVAIDGMDLHVSELKNLKKKVKAKFVAAPDWLINMRTVKDGDEITNIRKACNITVKVWEQVSLLIKVGKTEMDVSRELLNIMLALGADGIPEGFPPIVASGSNSAIPHHMTGSRKIQKGDVMLVDFGCTVKGYWSDMTRTIAVGREPVEYTKIKPIVDKAYSAAVKLVRPGTKVTDIDRAARDVINKAGYGKYFIHTTGHGLGLNIHEQPGIYINSKETLRKAMVITIEPGVYLPGICGYRYENTVMVTAKGFEELT